MKIGYACVSTGEQDLTLQTDALTAADCEKIFTDTLSGSRSDRPGLLQLLEFARSGDTLVIWRLDRLGRSLQDLIALVSDLERKGLHLCSLNEQIDTSSSTGKLVFHIFGAMAEFERNLIRERTVAGLQAARVRGRKGERPIKINLQKEKEIQILLKDRTLKISDIANRYQISRSTIYRLLNSKKDQR